MNKELKFGLAGAVVLGIGLMSAIGRLPRNILAGIRIPSTMRSDEAWQAGHRAAASALTASGLGAIVMACIVRVRKPSQQTQTLLLRITNGWLLAWIGLATIRASRAARATQNT